jgi:aspartyl-tRNA(Asn)/glutamyl-tRNA(Gln) amidotransferase subunit A
MGSAALHALTATEIATGVARRERSAVEVFDAIADRIERYNPALNAVIAFDRAGGRREAERADELVRQGTRLPLAGVPFTVKDTLWVAGKRATQGSNLFKDFVAPRDSWCVQRLRERGAVFAGITNSSEFACKGITNNLAHGSTHSPWRASYTPGGSSGGAASAVSAGFGPLALCTDAGGSTRRPAAHCGLVGMKPSIGLVPHPSGFDEPNFGHSVIGQLARTVRDAALMLECLAGYEPEDPLSHPLSMDTAFVAAAERGAPRELRIAFSRDLGCGFAIDADVERAVLAAVGGLEAAGHRIVRADPEWPEKTFEYPLVALQQAGLAALYAQAWHAGAGPIDPDLGAQIELGEKTAGPQLAALLLRRDEIHRCLARFFREHDLLLCPTAPVTSWPLDEPYPRVIGGKPASPRGHAAFTPLFNYCGVPACSVPCGLADNGLPVGIQIVGDRYSDALVLALAATIERTGAIDFSRPRTPGRTD